MIATASAAWGQELEPRAYANAPIGLNFLVVGYEFTTGGVATDPTLPVDDTKLNLHGPLIAYAYSLGVAGKSAKVSAVAASGSLSGSATFAGQPQERDISGLQDPSVRFSINLFGAPALAPREFASYRQDWIVGASLQVGAPLGQYDPTKVVNLGTNRWSIKPGFGVSKMVGSWTLEGSATATFFTDNHDYLEGSTRAQEPLYAVQVHIVRTFKTRVWIALDGNYYKGGAAAVDGIPAVDALSGSRLGATMSLPVDARNSLKIALSSGLSVRTAADYNAVSLSWQHLWGGGMK